MSDQPIKKNAFLKMAHTQHLGGSQEHQVSYWVNPDHIIGVLEYRPSEKITKATAVILFSNQQVVMRGFVGSALARMLNDHVNPDVACKCCNDPEPEPDDPEEPAEEEDDDSE